jgi:hypothetical protein
LPLRRGWNKVKGWFVGLLHLDDSPHRIALGVAVGVFIAVTPTWGVQMLLVVALAWLLGANKVAGIPMVWVTNPATNVPIYSFCYVIGQAVVGGPGVSEVREALARVSDPAVGWGELGRQWLALMWHAALPLWVGTVAVGLAAGVVCYVIFYYGIRSYRRRYGHHLHRARAEGAAAPPGRESSGSEGP